MFKVIQTCQIPPDTTEIASTSQTLRVDAQDSFSIGGLDFEDDGESQSISNSNIDEVYNRMYI
jgi:hypothetical protein